MPMVHSLAKWGVLWEGSFCRIKLDFLQVL